MMYHTVFTPEASIHAFPERTLADYQANMIARFGFLPSWERLAKMESREMRNRLGGVQQRNVTQDTRQAALDNPSCAAVLQAMTKPMTRAESVAATGMNVSTAKAAFFRLINAELIKRHSVTKQHVTRWEKA